MASHLLDGSLSGVDALVVDVSLGIAVLVLDILDRAKSVELFPQEGRVAPTSEPAHPDFCRWVAFAVADLALELPDVLAGELHLGAMRHVQVLIADEGIGIPGTWGRPLDVDVEQVAVPAKDSLHLLVRDVQLEVANEQCPRR